MKGDVWRFIHKGYPKCIGELWMELDTSYQTCIDGCRKGQVRSWHLTTPGWFEKVDMKSKNYQSLYNKLTS